MRVQKISKEEQTVKRWSGGTTTELFLWPPDGSYEKRNFLCRVSTAECLDRESVFTMLPGTDRILSVLDGEIRLRHNGGDWYTLMPGMQTSFAGDEKTESRGTCVDFNIMMKGGTTGSLRCLQLGKSEEKAFAPKGDFLIFYVASGQADVKDAEETCHLQEHDVCMVSYDHAAGQEMEKTAPEPVCIEAEGDAVVMAARVYLGEAL